MGGFNFGKEDSVQTKQSHQKVKTCQFVAQSKFFIIIDKDLKLDISSNKDKDRDEEGIKFELPDEGIGNYNDNTMNTDDAVNINSPLTSANLASHYGKSDISRPTSQVINAAVEVQSFYDREKQIWLEEIESMRPHLQDMFFELSGGRGNRQADHINSS